jgi:hypothetical protein
MAFVRVLQTCFEKCTVPELYPYSVVTGIVFGALLFCGYILRLSWYNASDVKQHLARMQTALDFVLETAHAVRVAQAAEKAADRRLEAANDRCKLLLACVSELEDRFTARGGY